ncbi:aminotransferase class I/II-fold pyridoxal phosphate-dependent enzyme [Cellulosilyticum sp. ST5]|uniref:aminotransferase class I/II-fold pyridoxal phosphate-dependent enzyme n=1 Tax=unclassified Cellulosilyticum TaxID=2643091 RepID=UPI000F8E49D4|nr:aminotransferase class I/II-fold pyridoxal phosphate-dependent enzyme [Cellulosilyticum sp. WCF-2]QEH69684.1 aminotransferase class I/II-fold pyridoxal phosphate-dependent enzyme [Cellulosilyticum sp. WCF-2]
MINYDELMVKRIMDVPPSGIRKFFDIANEMGDAISLGVGEPDFDTPWHIREEGIYSLEKGKTFYSANAGLLELREEICNYMKRRFDLSYCPKDQTLVTVGGSEAIDLALRILINPGDEVLIPEPCYVSYTPCTIFAGGTPVTIPTREENNFKLTPDELRQYITPRTKILILPYPNNPTGAIMEKEELEAIAEVLRETNIIVLSDEIYGELTYGKKHVSIASIEGMYERTILISGFSKSYAMTGWRLGYALGPVPLMKLMTKMHQFAIMCAPTTSQYAAIEAMRNGDDDVAMMCESYNKRRRLMVEHFRQMGLSCFEPEGAFYVFPSIKRTGMTSDEFCETLLKEEKVAVVPGTAFGTYGEGFIRCSYAYSVEELKEALVRIERFVSKRIK